MGVINVNVALGNANKASILLPIKQEVITDCNHRANISIITFINEFDSEEEKPLLLHYFFSKRREDGKNISLYIGSVKVDRCPPDDKGAVNNVISVLNSKNVPFIEKGKYRLEVYIDNDVEKGKDFGFKEMKNKAQENHENGELITFNIFNVIFNDDIQA